MTYYKVKNLAWYGEYLQGTNPIWNNSYNNIESFIYIAIQALVFSFSEITPEVIADIEF